MTVAKTRLEQLEREFRFRNWVFVGRVLENMTLEQREAFAAHGVVPAVLEIGPTRFDKMDRKTLIRLWQKDEAILAGRSDAELEHFASTGRFPDQEPDRGDSAVTPT